MKLISQLSIKIKLVLIVLAVLLPVLILFAGYSLMVNIVSSQDRLKSEIDNVAKMTTEYARPFLLFQDKTATEQLLQFQKLESIEYACVYDIDGEIVSEYQEVPEGLDVKYKAENSSEYIDRYLHTFANAYYDDDRIGTLYILANTDKVNKLINQSIQNVLLAILVSILIALGLVLLLQRFISEPILNLAKFTKSISESPDYGQRIENTYQDEVGTLYNSFNSMLDAIESTTVSRGYLNDILSSMAEMLIVLDNDFNIQKINEAVSEQMQYSSSELIGKKIDILLKRNTAEAFYQNEQVETNFYTKSGERKVVAISLSGLNTKSQNSSTIICTARDITEQQLAKEQLKRNFEELQLTQEQLKIAKELAEASSKAKSEFLSKMSHEIRTPMNAIIGMAHLLLQNNPQHEQKDDLKDLLLSSESLLTLINDILDFSHIEAGQVIFQKREFNIHNLVQNVVRSLRQDHVGMNLSIDERIPKIVKGDQKRLLQILTNLIHNAVKFTQKGEVSVDVKLDSYDAFKTYLSFSVEDTGVGIPEDKIGLIFESFSQVDNSLTRQYQGKGLGLSIVKHLLELQDSSIHLKSVVGKGSTFSFTLGFDNVTQKEVSKQNTKQKTLPTIKKLDGMKVLLVEDNRMNIIVTKKLLTVWKVTVEVAENGKIGVDKAATGDYDLILMDLQMPVMNGFEATKNIRLNPKHHSTPIIALTAEVMEESQQRAEEVGMNDFVTKPFNPNVLYQAMAQYAKNKN
ncbi:MAG: response regulator [Saprospiraceae bacterium]